MKVMVTTGAISRAKLQSNHHHQQTNIQFFYRPDALPVAHPTVSKHWRENATFHGLADPKLTWVFQSCLWPLKAPGYLGGRTVKTLVSPLTLVPFSIKWQLIKIILIRVLVTEPMKAFFVICLRNTGLVLWQCCLGWWPEGHLPCKTACFSSLQWLSWFFWSNLGENRPVKQKP